MRRRAAALVVPALAAGLAFASPWSAQAEQEDTCADRKLIVMTGNRSAALYDPGAAGCNPVANQNTRRILPGATDAMVRINRTGKQPYPISGVLTTETKTVDFDLTGDGEDPSTAGRFESGYLPIGSATKLTVTVTFSNGSVRETTYTR